MPERKVITIRNVRYDVTDFAEQHPGGRHMFSLGVGRDSTVMFESAHVRLDRAEKVLAGLPRAASDVVPTGYDPHGEGEADFPTPSKSELFGAIRRRVAKEVLRGDCGRGVPTWHFLSVIGTFLTTAVLFTHRPSVLTGSMLGLALAWIGTGVQHSANHGSLCRTPWVNYLLGLLDDVGPGGSSLVWRYHHQVSHHTFTNDVHLDQDVFAQFPVLRLDDSQPLRSYHRWQWLYGVLGMPILWFTIQWADLMQLAAHKAFLVTFWGTSRIETLVALALKALHVYWLFVYPASLHGFGAMLVPWAAVLGVGSLFLSLTFIVSHNIEETKGCSLTEDARKDWARWQIETSASWGGVVACFFTGGLSLQIEHHLFPCVRHSSYPEIQKIIKQECAKRGVRYTDYPDLPSIIWKMFTFLYNMGRPRKQAAKAVRPPPRKSAQAP
eukprot:TRINITY_DN4960_c0_g1_i2.p1 TRINITY_DN4960_c0_g1~~TRINITY_DN4960_c0_g1_i2.p1  ORF type:complete len:461 (+),score=145.09 TRINITY_DN4960_c0_g1_i2:69-1385(+)